MKYWYKLEYAFHMVEAYLAEQRGQFNIAADSKCRAWECERQLARLELLK